MSSSEIKCLQNALTYRRNETSNKAQVVNTHTNYRKQKIQTVEESKNINIKHKRR